MGIVLEKQTTLRFITHIHVSDYWNDRHVCPTMLGVKGEFDIYNLRHLLISSFILWNWNSFESLVDVLRYIDLPQFKYQVSKGHIPFGHYANIQHFA